MTCITFLLTYLVAFKSPCELRINLKLLRLSFHQQQDLQYHLNKEILVFLSRKAK
jgi:hypothetical protein